LSRYQVAPIRSHTDHFLGHGTSANVTFEEDPEKPGRIIAVKQFYSRVNRKAFFHEVDTLFELRHPCVIWIIGWSQDQSNTLQIRMELANNGSLKQYFDQHRCGCSSHFMTATQQGKLICDIVLGMRYVHSHGIIHRDLKPGNILLDGNWRGKIADFGVSRSDTAEGPPTPDALTWRYAAPEQLQRAVPCTTKVDVFSFGSVLYELLVGVPAFRVSPLGEDLPSVPAKIGKLMQDLIHRCWSKNPRDRPSFGAILNRFETENFSILPGADSKAIETSVLEVIRKE
jgi:serine/threonine protein kinase